MISEVRNLISLLSTSVKINKQGQFSRTVSYVQGQEREPKIREYFYFIDHQGMLFLDDARMKNFTSCFKEKKFLRFFFNRLTINSTGSYKEFPYISLCGKERNFVKCDDCPFVFTHVLKKGDQEELRLAYNHAGDYLTFKFQPEKIFMLPETGRVYHPAPDRAGSIGLIRSKLAIEFSKYFLFDEGEFSPPTQFIYENKTYNLDRHWYHNVIKNKPIQTVGIKHRHSPDSVYDNDLWHKGINISCFEKSLQQFFWKIKDSCVCIFLNFCSYSFSC